MSKTTDGPWFLDQYGHVYGWRPTENGKTSVLLLYNSHSDATSADKSLISAAPELLKALRTAKWMLERDYIDDQKMVAIKKCDEAIAKATGEDA
jgi:hypothetical protein